MEGARAKEIVRTYFERLLGERDLSVCDELLATDYVDHDAPTGTPPGPEATKQFMRSFFALHRELAIDLEQVIAEGQWVALRAIWHGIGRSGERFRQSGLVMIRVNDDGRLAERWSAYDPPAAG